MRRMMTLRKCTIVSIAFALITILSLPAFALNEATHGALNDKIVSGRYNDFSLDEYLKVKLGIEEGVEVLFNGKDVRKLFEEGGINEDRAGIPYFRSLNHFHDPLVDNWLDAGISGKQSSAVWAQNKIQLFGDYSWPDVRQYYYDALTAANDSTRNEKYADCFSGLGQLMHLVQDASVPEHTRNDAHVFYNYEYWLLDAQRMGELDNMMPSHTDTVNSYLLSGTLYNPEAKIPIAGLFDADQYVGTNPGVTTTSPVGLAEYTNANFFSRDTVDGDYPYPSLDSCALGDMVWIQDPEYPNDPTKKVRRKYYTKTSGGETGYRLATLSYEQIWGSTYMPEHSAWLTVRDDNVYKDYAKKLIPKAVKYSANLLNYFFRGDVEAVDATTTNNGDGDIAGITMKVINNTPTIGGTPGEIEPIGGGTNDELVVSYEYKSGGATVYGKSSPLAFDGHSNHTYRFINFTQPIPADATDKKYMLVYRGKLGAEDDAVAAHIINPEPVQLYNYNYTWGLVWYATNFHGWYFCSGCYVLGGVHYDVNLYKGTFTVYADHKLTQDECIAIVDCTYPDDLADGGYHYITGYSINIGSPAYQYSESIGPAGMAPSPSPFPPEWISQPMFSWSGEEDACTVGYDFLCPYTLFNTDISPVDPPL